MTWSEVHFITVIRDGREITEGYCPCCGERAYPVWRLNARPYYACRHKKGCPKAVRRNSLRPMKNQLVLNGCDTMFQIRQVRSEPPKGRNGSDAQSYWYFPDVSDSFRTNEGKILRSVKSISDYLVRNLTIISKDTGERYTRQDLLLMAESMYFAEKGELEKTVPESLLEPFGALKIVKAYSRCVPPKKMREAYPDYIFFEAVRSGEARRQLYFGVHVGRAEKHQQLRYQVMGRTEKPGEDCPGFVVRNQARFIILLGRWQLAQYEGEAVLYLSNINSEHYHFVKEGTRDAFGL